MAATAAEELKVLKAVNALEKLNALAPTALLEALKAMKGKLAASSARATVEVRRVRWQYRCKYC